MNSSEDRADGLDPMQREAIAWITRLTSGEATTDDAEGLKAWRARSPAHEQAFRAASLTWRRSGAHADEVKAARARLSRRLFLGGAGAGTALAAGWAGTSLGLLPSLNDLLSDHYTRVGEQKRVALPDGSVVEMDGGTAFDADFSGDRRTVRLAEGAALFAVVPDDRPFRTFAGPGEVTARDAAFSVTTGRGETLVACTGGRIDVACRGTVSLKAGQRTTLTASGASAPEAIDPENAAPWRRGLLIFEQRPLSDVVADINRHRRGRVVLAGAGLGRRRINGVFHLDRLDEIVDNLAASLKLASTHLPGGLVILS